jgi:hypothetical protein
MTPIFKLEDDINENVAFSQVLHSYAIRSKTTTCMPSLIKEKRGHFFFLKKRHLSTLISLSISQNIHIRLVQFE